MATYLVQVTRRVTNYGSLRVEADSPEHAREVAEEAIEDTDDNIVWDRYESEIHDQFCSHGVPI